MYFRWGSIGLLTSDMICAGQRVAGWEVVTMSG